ncbi:MAG TPA: TonB-dependent receptor [Candidatus Limnocylindrales bacterium]|nr:TonB-dependent receptor [Candidatus Limnocylindrales bacterium]
MNARGFISITTLLLCAALHAQINSTSSLSGVVADSTGALVPNAAVAVQNSGNGTTFDTTTGNNGSFTVPSLPAGTYAVSVKAAGFKEARIPGIVLEVGIPTNIHVKLELGEQTDTVTVQAESAVLQTQSSAVTTTLAGRQINSLPLVSREALDLVLYLPGVTTPGRPRTSTVDGMSKAAINITMDGINVQDNQGKSGDGFYTYVRPRTDAVEEVTVSAGAAGAESSGEGAVQIKFVTRSGTNQFHGSLYEYNRTPFLAANYWFNNRNLPADPSTGKAPKTRVLLNQFGGRLGGPIRIPHLFNGKDRAFFFVNYEEFRLPEEGLRTRNIFDPSTQAGVFQYVTGGGVQRVNLLNLAAANGQVSTIDPTVGRLLSDIAATTVNGGVNPSSDPNIDSFSFINKGGQIRRFSTVRFDYNVNSKNSIEASWNYQKLGYTGQGVDFLNNSDPAFPGFPNKADIPSIRFSGVLAWRSTFTTHIVNELRAGLQGGTIDFFPEVNIGQFTGPVANQQGFNLGIGAAGITSATVQNAPNRHNTPVKQVNDTLSITRNAHSLSFGGAFTEVTFWNYSQTAVPSITFGTDSTDPASAMFTAANFPGASSAQLSAASNIYAVLTGRVTAITANALLGETTGQYVYNGPAVQRLRQREGGLFAQDTWRISPTLTATMGLRWEVEFPFVPLNSLYTQSSYAGLFGISGAGNLFKPGVLTGQTTQYVPLKTGEAAYGTQWKNLGPSLGLAWTPNVDGTFLTWLLGKGGHSVLRGGYSVAFNREGISALQALSGNPGLTITASRNLTLGNLVTGSAGDTLPLLLRQTNRLNPPAFTATPSFPLTGAVTDNVNVIDPNLKMPYVQSWSFGLQREVTRNTVIEVRYLGNHALRPWTTINYNETNIVENGFLTEFKEAQQNLAANIAAGRGSTFKYAGPNTGTSPLPITLGYFSGVGAAQAADTTKYTSSLFSNSTYVNTLAANNPAPFTFVSSLTGNAGQRASALAAGLPANLFVANPDKSRANLLTNFGGSTYNAATVDVRRRFANGMLFDANYTFTKAMSGLFETLREGPVKAVSPYGIVHGFKLNWIYELPIGAGRPLLGSAHGVLNQIIGGWAINGTGRVQSGDPFNLGNVRLVGMTRNDLQSAVGMNFNDGARIAYFLPQDIIQNTIKAFNTSATSANGYGSAGAPTGRYIAPANGPGCIEAFTGQCGGTQLVLYGPHFTRFDISAVKKFRVNEHANVEFRAEFLNAFNNINFIVGSAQNDTNSVTNFSSQSFGQVTNAYQDTSTTYDPGGRLIQWVLRINF